MKKNPDSPTPAPRDLKIAGKRYWQSVVVDFVLESHHLPVLLNSCRQLDRAEEARAILAKEGLVTTDRFGQTREHPMVAVERAAHLAHLRLARELGLDCEPVSQTPRGHRRPGG